MAGTSQIPLSVLRARRLAVGILLLAVVLAATLIVAAAWLYLTRVPTP